MIGLTGMRERALAVGGMVELEPPPGGGTTVLACIPTTGNCREHVPSAAGDSGFADRGESIDADGPALTAIRTRLQELQRRSAPGTNSSRSRTNCATPSPR